jgi:hypothetical protein
MGDGFQFHGIHLHLREWQSFSFIVPSRLQASSTAELHRLVLHEFAENETKIESCV